MSNLSSFAFTIAVISFGLRIITDFLSLKMLEAHSKVEYEKTGKPSFLWSDNKWFIYFRYLIKKEYKTISDRHIVKYFAISRVLLIIFLISIVLFLLPLFVEQIAKVV